MNRQSIFFTITISFIISIILVVISFAILMIGSYKRVEHALFEKYQPIVRIVLRQNFRYGKMDKRLNEHLEALNYKFFDKKDLIDKIIYNPKTKILVERRSHKNFLFRVLQVDNRQFIHLQKRNKIFLIENKNELTQNPRVYIILVFTLILITLILSFIVTIKKLIPLKTLKDKVSTLGDEIFDFECYDTNRKDEVSLLALEFKNTAKKLKDIKEARNVFIRNIMHELKTPITKGKFLTEIERNKQNDEKLKEVFIRLETLINEFASIEELISSTKNIEKKFYFLEDIIDNAKDILMVEEDEIISLYKNEKLEVNYKLFSIAIKNLIDNAIKYSKDKKVTIKTEEQDIIFENRGKKLKYNLEKYYEPFFANEEKTKNSFGLGFYIVHNILKANNYILEYKYEDGINIFRCKKDEK